MVSAPPTKGITAFDTRVRELIARPAVTIGPDETIRDAATRMSEEGIGSLVVVEAGAPIGILTTTDMVRRVLAKSLDPSEPVRHVMSPNVVTVGSDAYLFEGLMSMIRHGIRHLVVVDHGHFTAVVSDRDWLSFQGHHPLALMTRISSASSLEALAGYRREALGFIQNLFRNDGNARALTELVTEINDRVTRRVIELSIAELKQSPPTAFAWLAMGSEGRREQTLSTDQDNGLVFANVEPERRAEVHGWFLEMAKRVNTQLASCGFPLCEGNTMASNPELCRSLDEWRGIFRRFVQMADLEHLLKASIYFDFRCLYGDQMLVDRMWEDLLSHVSENRSFLRFMAAEGALYGGSPVGSLSWKLRGMLGLRQPPVDIKKEGLSPLVRVLRVIALDLGSSKTHTLDRLDLAEQSGILPPDLAESARSAYEFVMLKRLEWQSRPDALNRSTPPNVIDLRKLNRLDRTFLLESMKAIVAVEQHVRGHYGEATIE